MSFIVDGAAERESHGGKQSDHLRVLVGGINLDAFDALRLAHLYHVFQKEAGKPMPLQGWLDCQPVDNNIGIIALPFAFYVLVDRFPVECHYAKSGNGVIGTEHVSRFVLNVLADDFLRRVSG